jgi:hypothetical protein
VTKDRKACYSDLLQRWELTMTELRKNTSFRAPLPGTPSAPGTGKTRFGYVVASRGQIAVYGKSSLDTEWAAALGEVKDAAFRADIETSVGVTVTFNHTTSPRSSEPRDHSLVGVRMLFSHFVRDNGVSYDQFLRLFSGPRPSPAEALAAIRLDVDTNHPLPGGGRRHIILVVDELLAAAPDTNGLVDITTGLGEIIDRNADVHVLVTSLSADALVATAGPSKRAVHAIVLPRLATRSVEELIKTLPDNLRKSLETDVFRASVRDCAGIPRLLEVVCKLVGTCGSAPTLQGVRAVVAKDDMVIAKQTDEASRNEAVLSAFSAWRFLPPIDVNAKNAFKHSVDALMKNGYLYRISEEPDTEAAWQQAGVPPLMLRAWDIKYTSDSNPLLSAAVAFLSKDDVVGAYDGRRDFEPQAEALIELLFLVDREWRVRASAAGTLSTPRTLRSLFGADKDALDGAVHASACGDPAATFNLQLFGHSRIKRTELDATFKSGFGGLACDQLNHFLLPNYKGADAVLKLRLVAVGDAALFVLFQWKFSDPSSAGGYDHYSSLAKTLAGRPELQAAFKGGRLCFVLLGARDTVRLTEIQFRNIVDAVVKEAGLGLLRPVIEELVAKSLVVIGKEHAKTLMGPTLASLVQFAEA